MVPISAASPVAFASPLPKACDVVVIGAGIIGIMTAWYLARRGLKVVVCEKGRVAGEQSSRNWGWVRQQGRDPAELPIMIEANRIWQGLESEAGEDMGFRRTGVLYMANSASDMAAFEAWMVHADAHQVDTVLLSTAETSAMVPGAAMTWHGGLWTGSDGRAEPWLAVPALARAASRSGVAIAEACAVRTLDIAAGRVAGVVTEQGRIACDQVVLAGGAWSALFARLHGVDLPQLSVLSTVVATAPMAEIFSGNAADARLAFRRRQDGGYTLALGDWHERPIGPDSFRHFAKFYPHLIKDGLSVRYLPAAPRHFPDGWRTPRRWPAEAPSPFEAMRVLDPRPSPFALRQIQKRFAECFPGLGRPPITTAWAGMIDSMPDVVPVVDYAAGLPGLFIATGMSGHGFGIGPAIGRIVADLLAGKPAGHDMSRFRFSRFSDGSPIRQGTAL